MNHKLSSALAALSLIALAPLAANAQSVTYNGGVGGAIPDNSPTGVSRTAIVGDDFALSDFTSVSINGLTHTWVGDLTITLSHNGTTVDILDRVFGDNNTVAGDSSNVNGNYTFVTTGGADFTAAAAAGTSSFVVPSNVNYATVPVGCITPNGGVSSANGLLSDFAGMSVNGTWTLTISDRGAADLGGFTDWRFTVFNGDINTNRTISDTSYSEGTTLRVGAITSGTDLTLAAGSVVQNVRAFNASRIVVSGGAATSLRAEDTARLFMNYGTVSGNIAVTENGRLTMGGGSAASVTVSDNGIANITDGTVGTVTANAGATAYLFDGTFTDLVAAGGDIYVYGGSISENTISAYGDGTVSLFGNDLLLDFTSAMTGTDAAGISGTFYDLTGTLTDGTTLDTRFFDADGGHTFGQGAANAPLFFNGVAVVPEAGTLALFTLAGIGTVGLVARRRR